MSRMLDNEDADSIDKKDVANPPVLPSYPCPDCGMEDPEPREPMFGGRLSGRHQCFCIWEDQPDGPMVLLATGVCCHRMALPDIRSHHHQNRRWQRLMAPRAVDWDEAASCVASTRRVAGDLWRQAGWPEPSPAHARLLSVDHRNAHWPRGPSEALSGSGHRGEMVATADEIAEWLMLARDRAMYSSGSILGGSADAHAAGELLARFADALADWDRWRAERVVEDAARTRRILAAAAFRWGASSSMFRHFVADHLDAGLAQLLGEKGIAVLACAMHLRRRGRPRKQDDQVIGYTKGDFGLDAGEEVPDKIEALQRLAASIGIPRMSSDAVEDQVQPLLARLAQIRREREVAFAELQNQEFESMEAAHSAFEDADILASVLEDEAIRVCQTRKKPRKRLSAKNNQRSRALGNSRRVS
jgi:hypothetical protein